MIYYFEKPLITFTAWSLVICQDSEVGLPPVSFKLRISCHFRC